MTLSGLGFCSWDSGVFGCWVVEGAWGGERIFSSMWKHTCTQNISLLTCFHCLHLRAFVMVTFGSHLICAAPLVPLSRISLLFSWGFFQASLLTVPSRAHASLSSLSLLALFLSTSPAIPAFTLILSLHFSIIVFSHYYFFLSFSLCLFFWHFLLPWIKHALYLYLSSGSIPVCVFFFFSPPFWLFHSPSLFLILLFMLFSPWELVGI